VRRSTAKMRAHPLTCAGEPRYPCPSNVRRGRCPCPEVLPKTCAPRARLVGRTLCKHRFVNELFAEAVPEAVMARTSSGPPAFSTVSGSARAALPAPTLRGRLRLWLAFIGMVSAEGKHLFPSGVRKGCVSFRAVDRLVSPSCLAQPSPGCRALSRALRVLPTRVRGNMLAHCGTGSDM